MNISARVINQQDSHEVTLSTNDREHTLAVEPKAAGRGSSANGGELLFLALATCYCNDLFREAKKRGIELGRVEVVASGEFGAEGEPACNIHYCARVESSAPRDQILDLMHHTDTVAEIQNTLRAVSTVTLDLCETF
ncbi:MAG TPA: OsmC family protein [Terracidiphilus sp.]|nr:OsmC family protein [Terracidiphilus sp.]